MKATRHVPIVIFTVLASLLWTSVGRSHELAFSTYFGGSGIESAREKERARLVRQPLNQL